MKHNDLKQLIKEAILEALIEFSTPSVMAEDDELKDEGSGNSGDNGGNTNPGDSIPGGGGLNDTIPHDPVPNPPLPMPEPIFGPVGF